ncbi:MAG TPA: hypothetical protein VGS22_15310 [Thermoanaerobaculia bacterium]|jgi:hypothetical protein|nr:hypothetical protein [Thermoanaerobaculia bacterium]
MGSHKILMSRLSAVARNEKIVAPSGDLLLGFKGTPNFKFMGAAGSYGWAVRWGDKALVDQYRKHLVDLFVIQEKEWMFEEQCAPDPHMAFYLASVGIAGFAGDLAHDQDMLDRVNKWLSGFLGVYGHGLGVNSEDPKKKLLFMPGFRCVSRTGQRTEPTSQDADSLYRLLAPASMNKMERKTSYWGNGSTKNLGLHLIRGLFDRKLIHPTPQPVGVRVPMAFARSGQHLLAWLDVPEPVTGVGACHFLEADLIAGTVLHFGTDWHGDRPKPPADVHVDKIQGSH